ncbi:hypothetical protein [uncultured Brevibacillus sp.]|uniref:hypothetical protein n=1 Tax=uncultured Brevibacillus sp. TaxID=169970 RepID=UPI002599D4A7|nr:hypothetical protein [uncultured Brevibacillus sp.]
MMQLSKEDLIEPVGKIMNVEGSEEEIDRMIVILKQNVPHPEVSDLIFNGKPPFHYLF